MTRWEYHVVQSRAVSDRDLNELGAEGWELIGDIVTENALMTLVFKRPVQE